MLLWSVHGGASRLPQLLISHRKRMRRAGLILSIIISTIVTAVPAGTIAAPQASRQPTGNGIPSAMPLVTGADFTLKGSMFQSDAHEAREQSLKDNLTLPKGSTQAIFTSDPTKSPIDFTDVAPHWWADRPDGTYMTVEMRTSLDGQQWDPWQAVDEEDIIMAEDVTTQTYASLVNVAQSERPHRFVQSRLTLSSDAPDKTPVFHELTYTFINAGVTPNPPRPQVMIQGTPSDVPKPMMVSRKDWGSPQGASSPKWIPKYKRVTHMVIHHTATSNADTDFAARVRAVWYFHAFTRGWGDIGYNYVIDPSGVIYEGRAGGDDVEAGHAYPFNNGTMGVGLLGNFMTVAPSAAAQRSLVDLLSWKSSQRGIDPHATLPITGNTECGGKIVYTRATIAGHRDYAGNACGRKFNGSTCPGDRLEAMLPEIRDAVVSEQPPLRANFGTHDTPGNVEPGATVDVRISVRNSGSLTWSPSGQGSVSIGYKWLKTDGRPVPGWEDIKSALPREVGFADTLTMTAKLNAPKLSGHFVLIWDMYRDGEGWFADQGSQPLKLDLVVGTGIGDEKAPTSEVLPLPVYSNNPEIRVRWAGEDNKDGSGIASYDIQFRIGPTGEWADWKTATSETEATFDGEDGYTYEFRARARDSAGNIEEWPANPDTYTTVDTRPPPLIIETPKSGDHVAPGALVVRGRTEPGVFVAVNDVRAEEANGVFTSTLEASGRDFLIHVTGADKSGNVSRLEVVVQAAPKYNDVPLGNTAQVAVEFLSDRGIVSGFNDGSFKPELSVTRAQFAKMLVLTMQWGLIKPPESRFTDVEADAWYFAYVETVTARGAMKGFMDGSFEPHLALSRVDALRAILTAAQRNVPIAAVYDRLPADNWAVGCDLVPGARNLGDDVRYCGSGAASRADVSLLIYNLRRALDERETNSVPDDHGGQ